MELGVTQKACEECVNPKQPFGIFRLPGRKSSAQYFENIGNNFEM